MGSDTQYNLQNIVETEKAWKENESNNNDLFTGK